MKKKITVFTPTYNRAYCLDKCYKSLTRQTSKEFIWLIVDDGSNDNTFDLVEEWKIENKGFEIIYIYKDNGGMHTAHNTAYKIINTELNMCIDSDDYLTDNAIEKILELWDANKTEKYSGIVALDINKNGEIIGNKLPDVKDIRLCDYYKKGGKGDKKLIFRTDVMQRYPDYPIFEGEKFVPLGYKYLLADQDYKLLVLNQPVCIVEYMEDGSTRNIFRQYIKNPNGFIFSRKIQMQYGIGFFNKFKASIHYVSNNLIAGNINFLKETPKIIMTIGAIPFGIALYYLIKFKTRKIK